MLDLVFKYVCLFVMSQSSMFTVNNKDTRTTSLTSVILNIVNIDILNIEQLSHIILVLKLLTLNR